MHLHKQISNIGTLKLSTLNLYFLICFFLIISCEKENISEFKEQKIFFEHYAINYAWGLSYLQWIIDYEGNVRKNKERDSIIWIDPENLNSYLEMFDTIIYNIDKTELDYYIQLIPNASKGEILEIEQNRADFGGTVYYSFKPKGHTYEIVILSEMSDIMDKTNLDSSAMKIDKWLKDIQKHINSNN